jgi:hypothetical protein
METKANEPAYPNIQVPSLKELTKREYFAAMAMQGLLADYESEYIEDYSKYAVKLADALIEELNKTKTNEKK